MNTIEALKKLYVALGGEAADVASLTIIPDMINAISEIVHGVARLPEVTADDNGKVLKVIDGAWDKAEAEKELPTVTADDNGKVLKVIDGAWGVGADLTE